SPLRADKNEKIEKLSVLLRKKSEKKSSGFSRAIRYMLLLLLVLLACMAYQQKETFRSFLLNKAQKISQSVSKKIAMVDVKYVVEGSDITVSGDIVNEDKFIAKVAGVRIEIFDAESTIVAWDVHLDEDTLLPEQKSHFSTTKPLPREIREMRVEVSAF
ncbi:MAG: hypothetical protein LBB34_04185, partial [Holosporales bacterium]|nr:hypothetical protein [Holosporales bacterium]